MVQFMAFASASQVAAAAEETGAVRIERRRAARSLLDSKFATAGRPVIVALGRLHPFKGIETLVRAMATVRDGILVIVGPSLNVRPLGDTATRLLGLAEALGVRDRVRWVGPVAPTGSLDMLAAADVVAVPSHVESLNKVCIEAAAVGTPFVVTETTGITAWVPDTGVGILVPPADPVALGEALISVINGRWLPNPTRLSAFVRPFSPRAVAEEVVEIYEKVRHDWGNGLRG